MRTEQTSHGLLGRFEALQRMLGIVDTRIARESARPAPDMFVIQRLARLRMRVKEEMASIGSVLRLVAPPSVQQASLQRTG